MDLVPSEDVDGHPAGRGRGGAGRSRSGRADHGRGGRDPVVGARVGRPGSAAAVADPRRDGVGRAVWWRVGPALAASGRLVTAVDQAGHGRTGHWQGHHRFRDNAADIAAFARAAGLDRPRTSRSSATAGARVTAAALPVVGLRPATLVLLDPPVLPLERIALEASRPETATAATLDEAIAAIRSAEPDLGRGRRARRRPRPSWSSTSSAARPCPRQRRLGWRARRSARARRRRARHVDHPRRPAHGQLRRR